MGEETILTSAANSIVANADAGDGVGFDPMLVITLLPLLMELPCLKVLSVEGKRKWVERHPGLARVLLAKAVRNRDRNMSKARSFALADSTMDYMLSTDNAELKAICEACASI